MKQIELNKIYNEDCIKGIARIPDASVDCILTDPPYLYLKNQKLDRSFDEITFFNEVKRVLKPNGFVILFGRGTSFYRWNTILAELGFQFKEEIIWDKSQCSSPLMAISRVHETISMHSINGVITKVKVPYIEMKSHDIDSICQDINRLKSVLKNPKSLKAVQDFLVNNKRTDFYGSMKSKGKATYREIMTANKSCTVIQMMEIGMNEKTIIRTDRMDCDTFTKFGVNSDKRKTGDRCCNVMQSMEYGLNEKSIIKSTRDHYTAIHPTQKPVRLLERLLALTTKPGDVVLDPFSGSCSTAVACINTNRKYIGFEIDKEYYDAGVKRVKTILSEPKLEM